VSLELNPKKMNHIVLESNRAMFESNIRCNSNHDWIDSRFDFALHCS